MKKYFSFFIAFAILFVSCEKQINIDIPEKAPRLVLNSILEKGDSIRLVVGKTRHILSPSIMGNLDESYAVKDARAIVFENNIAVDTLVYFSSTRDYRSTKNTVVRAGIVYTYKVSSNGYSQAEVSSTLPSQSVIAEVVRVKNAKTNSGGYQMDEISIKLNDPAAEKNFYLVQIFPAWSQNYYYPVYCVNTNDKDLEQIGDNADSLATDNCFNGGQLLLSDANFNGKQKLLKVFVEATELRELPDGSGNIRRPFVRVLRITEDYFKYLRSYNSYLSASDNPFAEPVNVFTNVKNGLGIFALSTTAVDTLR
jgi:hypothetical protein